MPERRPSMPDEVEVPPQFRGDPVREQRFREAVENVMVEQAARNAVAGAEGHTPQGGLDKEDALVEKIRNRRQFEDLKGKNEDERAAILLREMAMDSQIDQQIRYSLTSELNSIWSKAYGREKAEIYAEFVEEREQLLRAGVAENDPRIQSLEVKTKQEIAELKYNKVRDRVEELIRAAEIEDRGFSQPLEQSLENALSEVIPDVKFREELSAKVRARSYMHNGELLSSYVGGEELGKVLGNIQDPETEAILGTSGVEVALHYIDKHWETWYSKTSLDDTLSLEARNKMQKEVRMLIKDDIMTNPKNKPELVKFSKLKKLLSEVGIDDNQLDQLIEKIGVYEKVGSKAPIIKVKINGKEESWTIEDLVLSIDELKRVTPEEYPDIVGDNPQDTAAKQYAKARRVNRTRLLLTDFLYEINRAVRLTEKVAWTFGQPIMWDGLRWKSTVPGELGKVIEPNPIVDWRYNGELVHVPLWTAMKLEAQVNREEKLDAESEKLVKCLQQIRQEEPQLIAQSFALELQKIFAYQWEQIDFQNSRSGRNPRQEGKNVLYPFSLEKRAEENAGRAAFMRRYVYSGDMPMFLGMGFFSLVDQLKNYGNFYGPIAKNMIKTISGAPEVNKMLKAAIDNPQVLRDTSLKFFKELQGKASAFLYQVWSREYFSTLVEGLIFYSSTYLAKDFPGWKNLTTYEQENVINTAFNENLVDKAESESIKNVVFGPPSLIRTFKLFNARADFWGAIWEMVARVVKAWFGGK